MKPKFIYSIFKQPLTYYYSLALVQSTPPRITGAHLNHENTLILLRNTSQLPLCIYQAIEGTKHVKMGLIPPFDYLEHRQAW
jgi:hypothetical protein